MEQGERSQTDLTKNKMVQAIIVMDVTRTKALGLYSKLPSAKFIPKMEPTRLARAIQTASTVNITFAIKILFRTESKYLFTRSDVLSTEQERTLRGWYGE